MSILRLLRTRYLINVRANILPFFDTCCGFFSAVLAWMLVAQYPLQNSSAPISWYTIGSVGLYWAIAPHFIDGYNPARIRYRRFHIETIGNIAIVFVSIVLASVVFFGSLVPIRFLMVCTALSPALVLLGRSIGTDILYLPRFQRKVLIVGAGWAGRTIAREMRERSAYGYKPIGFLDHDPIKHGTEIEGLFVLGSDSQLQEIIQETGVDFIVVAITHGINPELSASLYQIRRKNISVVRMAEMYEWLTRRVPVHHLPEHWISGFVEGLNKHRPAMHLPRLALNHFFGLLLLTLFLPLIPLIAFLILLTDGRPVFFTQRRVGKDEQLFTLYKFRTMKIADAGDDEGSIGNSWKSRITPVGRFLRATHLDEIPQFFNVIRGDINLVGPRPFIPHEVELLSSQVPYYNMRFHVKPGITGHAQLFAGYENTPETALEKLEYDLFYIKYCSIWLDLSIVFRTVFAVFLREGK